MPLTRLSLSSLFLALSLVACGGGGGSETSSPDQPQAPTPTTSPTPPAPTPTPPASKGLALINGKIYTGNPQQKWAEAVVIKDGRISFVGSSADAQGQIAGGMEVVDLQGKLALPGLHDVHMHPLEAGSDAVSCELKPNTPIASQHEAIRACGKQETGSAWVLGWGHSLAQLLEAAKTQTPRSLLDSLVADRPAALMEETSHSVWVNSRALALAGIVAATPHPQGGAILKDGRGEPNGILLDAAGDQVFERAFAPTENFAEANYRGLLQGLGEAAKYGITSLADARVYWRRGHLAAWQRAEREGKLSARASLGLWAYPALGDEEQLAALKAMYSDDPARLLRVNQIKFYVDGILHNSTALLHTPYREFFPEVGPNGLNYFTEERLGRFVTELERAGFDMHIHAIGDRGVHQGLNAIQAARTQNGPNATARHRLTHLELVEPADRPRFKALGVIADLQVAGDFALPQNYAEMEPLIGARAGTMLPLRALWDTGATVTLSSDWDVSSLSPFVGMQHALQLGAQSLPDRESVVQAYTVNAAYALRQEARTGSLEPGKFGDLVIVDRNIFDVPVADIGKTRVLQTILGGKRVYQAQ